MKGRPIVILVLLSLCAAGCLTQGKPKVKDTNVRVYFADLKGDGEKEIVETQGATSADSTSVVTVKNNEKAAKVIDSLLLAGKIKNIEFIDMNLDGRQSIVVYFDTNDFKSNIGVYKLNNDKLSKIFSAASEYGIETNFESTARIKVGKAPKDSKSPAFVPDWDTWVWSGDKFIKE